jgi:hypothetical protein
MKTSATRSDASTLTLTGSPSSEKKPRIMGSPMNMPGRKTMTVVSVARETASPTSFTPRMAAARGEWPSKRWRMMFSTTTIELSTSMPTPRVSPMRLRMLKDWPRKNIQTMVMRNEKGIESVTSTVIPRLRKKR